MEHALHRIIKNIEEQLIAHYKDEVLANQYAWWMLEELTQRSKTELLLHDALSLSATQHEQLKQWIKAQVEDHKPLAYVIGWVPFMDFKIICKAPTLIPRPETEEWVGNLINMMKRSLASSGRTGRFPSTIYPTHNSEPSSVRPELARGYELNILDLCTGSGCIAIALAKAFPAAHIIATDISDSALALAQKNATANNVTNIEFIKSDVYSHIASNMKFDLIVSNPPYIAPAEWESLDSSVSTWEDPQALAAPDHGLAILKKIIKDAHHWLKKDALNDMPRLVLEIGYLQGPTVKSLMEAAGFERVEIKKDMAGKDRTVWG